MLKTEADGLKLMPPSATLTRWPTKPCATCVRAAPRPVDTTQKSSRMEPSQITLSPADIAAVRRMAQRLGKTETELLHEAVADFMRRASVDNWKMTLTKVKGMWADHPDAPDTRQLRGEWQGRSQQLAGAGDE